MTTPAEYEARIERLREALSECVEDFEYACSYKGDYLSKKHGDTEESARYRAALSESPTAALEADRLAVGMRVAERVRAAAGQEFEFAESSAQCARCVDVMSRLDLDALVRSVLKEGK